VAARGGAQAEGQEGAEAMNAFLVIGRCGMDDVPLRLFPDYKTAADYAAGVTRQDVISAADAVYRTDVSQIILVAVVEFKDGVSQEFHVEKDLEDGLDGP
jgi:hypothetical protein